jgi:hypothetical protein
LSKLTGGSASETTTSALSLTGCQHQENHFINPLKMDSETYDLSIQLQNVTMGSTQLTRFSFFPKLPIEIRINIWRLHSGYAKRHSFDAGAGEESPITPNPTLLKVNRESRNETLRSLVPLQSFYRGGIKYFNPALDTIRF